jgi:hypothetical protein
LVDPSRLIEIQRELTLHPEQAWLNRELGVLYLQSDNSALGLPFLSRAYELGDRNPELLFYLGLATEMEVDYHDAILYYGFYTRVPRTSPFRRFMQGRYLWLIRQIVQEQVVEKIREEQNPNRVPPQAPATTNADYPFFYQGANERYRSVGRGLAEMMSTDLAKLSQLTIVERLQMQALIDELNLSTYF